MFTSARAFFQLDDAAKSAYTFGPYGNEQGGFTPMGTEAVARTLPGGDQAPPDLVENYVLLGDPGATAHAHSGWAHHHTLLAGPGTVYHEHMCGLMNRLHRMSALALGLEPTFFESYYKSPTTSLRLASYPAVDSHSVQPGQLRYGAHHDYQGLTLLALQCTQDTAGQPSGLQVHLDDAWHDVPLVPDSFVVNIGELFSLWTGGAWRSTLHRVRVTEQDLRQQRLSIPFFTGPNADALIQPLQDSDPQFTPIRAHDHLMQKLNSSNT